MTYQTNQVCVTSSAENAFAMRSHQENITSCAIGWVFRRVNGENHTTAKAFQDAIVRISDMSKAVFFFE